VHLNGNGIAVVAKIETKDLQVTIRWT